MKTKIIITLIFIGIITISCNENTAEISGDKPTDLIEITKAQFEFDKMQVGLPALRQFTKQVHFTGTINPSVNGIASISLSISGIIKKINCNVGEFMNKGQVLFQIRGNEFIDIQRDFAESSAMLVRLKSDYERTKELFSDNIGTQKKLLFAESAYKSEMAKYVAIKMKLEQIGLDVSKIENGNFYYSYTVKSPIKGYVSDIKSSVGQYVEQQSVLAEIIDPNQFQLKLNIFEKDINKLVIGQDIEFYLSRNQSTYQKAKLTFIGKTINQESKAIDCYAEIKNITKLNVVNNQFVEGEIIVGKDSVYSLPETAFIKQANENYILVLESKTEKSYFFKKMKVKTGSRSQGYVELIDELPKTDILIKGTYNVKID